MMHLYAFGSICRGELDRWSDVDLLACITGTEPEFDRDKFSVYKHSSLRGLWIEGNPFAWHLHLESRLLYSSDGVDFIKSLGVPSPYRSGVKDCEKFALLFRESLDELVSTGANATFNLSCMFLGVRNFATCYSLWRGKPIFSRRSPLLIDAPLNLDEGVFDVFKRARILSTRGIGDALTVDDVNRAVDAAPIVRGWMNELLDEVAT